MNGQEVPLLFLSNPSSTNITIRTMILHVMHVPYYDILLYPESGSGVEDYTVTFPAGQISVPIKIPIIDFVMLGDTISFNITVDESSLPTRVTINNPDEASLIVWFTQRKLEILYATIIMVKNIGGKNFGELGELPAFCQSFFANF